MIKIINKLYHPEQKLCQLVESTILKTNFKVIGKEVPIKFPDKGKCDLWLSNNNNFLLSLELKTNKNKIDHLGKQVIKYTNGLSHIFPEYYVCGIGLCVDDDYVRWLNYKINHNDYINQEINKLKNEIFNDLKYT